MREKKQEKQREYRKRKERKFYCISGQKFMASLFFTLVHIKTSEKMLCIKITEVGSTHCDVTCQNVERTSRKRFLKWWLAIKVANKMPNYFTKKKKRERNHFLR